MRPRGAAASVPFARNQPGREEGLAVMPGHAPRRASLLLLCLGMGLAFWGCEPPPLQVSMLGCAVLHGGPDPSCDLAESRVVRLLIVTAPEGEVTFVSDKGPVAVLKKTQGRGERLLQLTLPGGASQLEVQVTDGWFRGRTFHAAVRDRTAHEAPWLTEGRRLLDENQPVAAQAVLAKHIGAPEASLPAERAESQALAVGLLAEIALEDNRSDARELLDRAIRECKDAHLISAAGNYLLRKSWLLGKSLHRFNEAESVLRQEQPLFDQLPDAQTWALSQRALMRREQGDLRGALLLFNEAEALMNRLGNNVARAELNNQLGTTLVMMGRMQEADEHFSEATQLLADDCRRGKLLNTQGFTFFLAQKTLRPTDPMWSHFSPRPPLQEAAEIFRKCKMPADLSNALTNLAHLAAGEEEFSQAASWLQQAREALKQPDMGLAMEWTELDGELALSRQDPTAAEAHYKELARLGQAQDSYESVWLSHIGQARALEQRAPAAARAQYWRAEEYLDHRSLELPLGAGRGTFLGRFERGTARYLDLLVREGDLGEAVRVARHSRARGLMALGGLARAGALSPSERQRWDNALASYRQARRELDEIAAGAADEAEPQQRELEREQPARIRQLLGMIDEALPILGSSAAATPPRAAAAGELMLLCYPQGKPGWHCFAWDQDGVIYRPVARMDEQNLGTMLDEARDKLARAHRLTVIAYGEMREIEVHLLRLPGQNQPLEEQFERLEVVYALDLPGIGPATTDGETAAPSLRKKALLVFDPQGRLPQSRRAAGPVTEALRNAGWEVVMQLAGVPRVGDYAGKLAEQPLLSSEKLRELLNEVALFHYGGHGDFEPVGGWGHKLRIAEGPGLLVGDIVMLKPAPERVMLFGCHTGYSAEESGRVEGLGLAQAFLLRGSHFVIATARRVTDRIAAEVAMALYADQERSRSITGETPAPARVLREVRRQLRGAGLTAEGTADLGSFRVFVP